MSTLLSPFSVRGLEFRNRIVLPPMCQWLSTQDGSVQDYHLAHYGQRAISGTALLIVEATAVEDRARITGNDLGAWSDDQIPGLKRLASMMTQFGAVPGIQLGHAGRKAWKDGPTAVAPSALAFSEKHATPSELHPDEIAVVLERFVRAAQRACEAGFRVIELHAAHGYLLHQFLSPISNKRADSYGGSQHNRMRFPLEVTRKVRASIPSDILLMLRVSAVEYDPAGYTLEDMVHMCSAFKDAGADMIHVSSGGSVPTAPAQWPGYQLDYARAVKSGASVPTIGVGRLESPGLAEFALRQGYCDMVAVGREMLRDAGWSCRAAIALGDPVPVVEPLRQIFQPSPK